MMKMGMMACCAIMVVVLAMSVLAGGAFDGLWSGAAIFVPLLLCIVAHVLIHRTTKKSLCPEVPEAPQATVTSGAPDSRAQRAAEPDVTVL